MPAKLRRPDRNFLSGPLPAKSRSIDCIVEVAAVTCCRSLQCHSRICLFPVNLNLSSVQIDSPPNIHSLNGARVVLRVPGPPRGRNITFGPAVTCMVNLQSMVPLTPPSENEHGKFSGKASFECTDCLLHRLPVHPLPARRLPVHRLPVIGCRFHRRRSSGTLRVPSPNPRNFLC